MGKKWSKIGLQKRHKKHTNILLKPYNGAHSISKSDFSQILYNFTLINLTILATYGEFVILSYICFKTKKAVDLG